MSARVLSTDQAKASIVKMQSIISGGLSDQVRQIDAEGQTLSDPNVWDGPLAANFRGQLWPETKTALDRCVIALEELRSQLESINQNIMAAGGG